MVALGAQKETPKSHIGTKMCRKLGSGQHLWQDLINIRKIVPKLCLESARPPIGPPSSPWVTFRPQNVPQIIDILTNLDHVCVYILTQSIRNLVVFSSGECYGSSVVNALECLDVGMTWEYSERECYGDTNE